ncbi:1-phosphofructokinase family hexose kinase [Smaragdicoccus niigatensis]|uniref:1-phosphofructokinase family hexose kinase n=1 Tax=Smaragdicoccus niigatensis TaxID=359359 RepID=UPI00278C1C2E|nr:1-phosphofructokinase family hexose kinase [Smaragdicoccus niigatensis]
MRCSKSRYDPGGGGINVARVAQALGEKACAVFPAGGLTGGQIIGLLAEASIPMAVVAIEGPTRESFTVNETETGNQYRFVLPGPSLTESAQRQCLTRLSEATSDGSFVVASGSLPPGVPPGFLNEVARLCSLRGLRLVVDTSGAGLSNLSEPVYLLKPSVRELREFTGLPLDSDDEQAAAAEDIVMQGRAEIVVVSKAAAGVLLVSADGVVRIPAVPVPPGSGVGAGDALVAGIVVGLTQGLPVVEAVRYGMAAGAAMLLTPGTEVCKKPDVERLYRSFSAVSAEV